MHREMLLEIARSYPWTNVTIDFGSDSAFCGVYSCQGPFYGSFLISRVYSKDSLDVYGNIIDRLDLNYGNTPVLAFDWKSGRELKYFWTTDFELRDLKKFKIHPGAQVLEKIVREWITPNSIRLIKNL